MLDTISLRLTQDQFNIGDHSVFSPNVKNFFNPPYVNMGQRGHIDAYSAPRRIDIETGIYQPTLKLRKRYLDGKYRIYLYIDFSIPKLLFGNNFMELINRDYSSVVQKLCKILKARSIEVSAEQLEQARLVKVHFSKNIKLTDYVIPSMIIEDISKIDLNLRYNFEKNAYRNNGDALRYHTNNFEVIFYDKKRDLLQAKKSEKKSIEKNSYCQLNIFEKYPELFNSEIFRIEARYNNTQAIKRILPNAKVLKDVFNSEVSKTVLTKIWQEMIETYKKASVLRDNEIDLLNCITLMNPDIRLSTALSTYAYFQLANKVGIRQLRKIVENQFSRRAWYSLQSKVNGVNFEYQIPNYLEKVSTELENFVPIQNTYEIDF